jgi:uncharacterized cupredoxin-like copper-binding protein
MRIRSAAVAMMVLLGFAACGGSGGSGGQPAGSIKVSMTEFKFTPSSLQAKSGKVVFFLENAGSTAHDMVIANSSGKQVAKSDLVQAGNQATFTVDNLPAGGFTFFCDLPGHQAAGMQGTLTVT